MFSDINGRSPTGQYSPEPADFFQDQSLYFDRLLGNVFE